MTEKPAITWATQKNLYAASHHLDTKTKHELGLTFPVQVFLQDPLVGKNDSRFGIDHEFHVRWEPGITDGPTSARFAVVDYNGETDQLASMAIWDEVKRCFRNSSGSVLDEKSIDSPQFHQVNVWAHLQRTLEFFESAEGLGRTIPFGFEGNRLIVVPHAGYGKNAYYDRASKSLQFYFFDWNDPADVGNSPNRIYTCLSTDIISHEFAHAVLDGIRPWYQESVLTQTAAFHESLGDMTAILIALEHEPFRHALIKSSGGDISTGNILSSIADEFGKAVSGKPYLRSANNNLTMSDIKPFTGHHKASEVLTGAMFDVLIDLIQHYFDRGDRVSQKQAFARATKRIRRLVLQALDFLPPIDVTFRDYALAVIRADEISSPIDPHDVRGLILKVFQTRGLLQAKDIAELMKPRNLNNTLRLKIHHEVDQVVRSRAHAYRFLDDNRQALLIPSHRDIQVVGLYQNDKMAGSARKLPRQIVIEYLWREDISLEGGEFGAFQGEATSLLCGGTLVFDNDAYLQHWSYKPGTEFIENPRALQEGQRRLADFLKNLQQRIGQGQVGTELGGAFGLLSTHIPPIVASRESDRLSFRLSPHIGLSGEDHEHYEGYQWEISS